MTPLLQLAVRTFPVCLLMVPTIARAGEQAPAAQDAPAEDEPAAQDAPTEDPPAAQDAPTEDPPAAQDAPIEDPPAATPPPESSPAPMGPTGPRRGWALPGGLRLNGYFDVAYERHNGTGDADEGHNELRNYHHFLFLSRQVSDNPIGFSLELVDLTFYEINARWAPRGAPWRLGGRAGKLLVPFGADPLFHTSYGGRAGFDQELLPVIWSVHGAAVDFQYRFAFGLSVRNELYGLQGFELPAADAVLNLQSDTSPVSDVRLAWGDRLSVAFGPVSLYYSAYFNPLDFDRSLFMQALDLQIYRLPGIPVVRDFALKLGVVRADVSGAGAGEDYYHFGDYLEMRYYPTEWLFLQLRGGFLTFDNRDGLYYDDRRADVRDRAAYNAAVAFMYDGLVISVYYFWNFEKVNERDDDFLRVWVTYAF